MPKIRFIGALFLSIVLVIGALWFRFVRIEPYTAQAAFIQAVEQLASKQNIDPENFLKTEENLVSTTTEVLTPTAALSRALFTDYMTLKSQGPVTSDQITTLAEKYASSMANFGLHTEEIGIGSIATTTDSEENLAAYGKSIVSIRKKYQDTVKEMMRNGNNITDTNNPAFFDFMGEVGKLYEECANELLVLKVSASLAENHRNLINYYLKSSGIMASVGNGSKDPIQAYAALIVYSQNTEIEDKLLLNIHKMLIANGVFLETSII